MNANNRTMNCPRCNQDIDITDLMYEQVAEQIKSKHTKELERVRLDSSALAEEKIEGIRADSRKWQGEQKQQSKEEIERVKKDAKADAEKDQSMAMKNKDDELKASHAKVQELSGIKAENERLNREHEENDKIRDFEYEKKYSKDMAKYREGVEKRETDRSASKLKEQDDKHDMERIKWDKSRQSQSALIEEMKRKQEQGSMQTQGEVQELAIEGWLRQTFPYDEIKEIKKGESGADTLQIVHTPTNRNCGTIYYESKNAKGFSKAWISKFKKDIQAKNADIGVLVTNVMPSDMPTFGNKEGIIICSFADFKALSAVLRDGIIRQNSMAISQENKGDKMAMLYDFITSNEYRLHVQAILDSYTEMELDLNQEKRAMTKIWAKREKHINGIIMTTSKISGAIEGIAGNAVLPIPQLELPADDDDLLEYNDSDHT